MPKIKKIDALRTRTFTGVVYGRQDLPLDEAVALATSIWNSVKNYPEVTPAVLAVWVPLMQASGIKCLCGQSNPLVLNIGHPHDDGYLERGKDPKHQGRSGKPFWDRQIKMGFPHRTRRRLECSNCSDLAFDIPQWWNVTAVPTPLPAAT